MEGGSECRPDAVQPVVRRKVVLRNSEINWSGFIPLLLNKCLEPHDRHSLIGEDYCCRPLLFGGAVLTLIEGDLRAPILIKIGILPVCCQLKQA